MFRACYGPTHKAFAALDAGRRDEALRAYRTTLTLKQRLRPDGVNGSLANSLRDLGQRHLQTGDTAGAIRYFQQALDARIKLFGGPHPRIAASYADLGRTYARAGDPARARANFQQALDMRLTLYPDGVHRSIVRTYRALAQAARDAGDKKAAAVY